MSKKPERKNRRFRDPWKFYEENYDGLSRSNLRIIDESLYRRLRKDGLLERISLIIEREDYRGDELRFYYENFSHMSKKELQKKKPGLYKRLMRKGLLNKIPSLKPGRISRYGENPLKFYNENYSGLTRGKVYDIDNGLYQALRSKGLIECIPTVKG